MAMPSALDDVRRLGRGRWLDDDAAGVARHLVVPHGQPVLEIDGRAQTSAVEVHGPEAAGRGPLGRRFAGDSYLGLLSAVAGESCALSVSDEAGVTLGSLSP